MSFFLFRIASTNKKRGFIALMSILIISLVLLFAVFSIGQKGIAGRLLLLDLERKNQSDELARACVQIAIIGVANDPQYRVVSAESHNIDTSSCTIVSVSPDTPTSGQTTIKTSAMSPGPTNGAVTNLNVVVDYTDGSIKSWTETPN